MLHWENMKYIIVGLGNPGDEYEGSRHNAGRSCVQKFQVQNNFEEWSENKKTQDLLSEGNIGKNKVLLLLPETFMNHSGKAVSACVKSVKAAQTLIVVYDDIDLPLGAIRVAFGRSSGGHRGLESVIKSIKTKDFIRVRIGVSPSTPKGKLKKPRGEQKVLDFLLGSFRKPEEIVFKKVSKKVNEILITIITNGRAVAMNKYN